LLFCPLQVLGKNWNLDPAGSRQWFKGPRACPSASPASLLLAVLLLQSNAILPEEGSPLARKVFERISPDAQVWTCLDMFATSQGGASLIT
jgi:hypothetical protein